MGPERFVRGDEHFRMISKAEIIIGAKVNYGARFAAVGDHRARICRGEKLGFIQFGGPRPDAHPICKARWSLQRVVALARKKITETKFCRVLVHHAVYSLPADPIIALTIIGSKDATGIN